MTYLLIGLVALAAFFFGMASFGLVLYQRLFKRMMAGRPAYLMLPGSRPNTQVTYAVTDRGWRRLTPKGPSKKARRAARKRARQAIKQSTPAQTMRAALDEEETADAS